MNSASGQLQIATAICDSIIEYFECLEQMTIKEATTPTTESSATPEETVAMGEGYTIQLMASAQQLEINSKRFGELHSGVVELLGKGTYKYKYCYGAFSTLAEAKAELERVRKSYGDAYIVQYKGNELK